MRPPRWIVLMLLGSLVACAGVPTGVRERMLSVLHEGGYVIFFRHATTDWSQKDTDLSDLKNCAAQRNLADAGRAQARAIGEAFNHLAIPVGEVLASPYCRTLETAQLGFGRVQATEDLRHIDRDTARARIAGLARLVNTAPAAGLNTVLISHHPNLEALTGVVLDEGEAAIFKPGRGGQYQLIYRVKARVWTELVAMRATETQSDPILTSITRRTPSRAIPPSRSSQSPSTAQSAQGLGCVKTHTSLTDCSRVASLRNWRR